MISIDRALELEGHEIEVETRLGELFKGVLSKVMLDCTLKIETDEGAEYIPKSQAISIRSTEEKQETDPEPSDVVYRSKCDIETFTTSEGKTIDLTGYFPGEA